MATKVIFRAQCPFHIALNYIDLHLKLSVMASPSVCFRTFGTIYSEKWDNLVNEAVKGSLFIIEQTVIMIWLLFKKKKA